MDRTFHVYMMASKSGVLYLGMTNNLERRVREHKQKQNRGFTEKYNVARLVWFEEHAMALGAIAREKEFKKWRREKKVALIQAKNPTWKDLGREIG